MRFNDIFRMSLIAITRNKTRSLLTTLGIVIGVASVIAMLHLGQAAARSVTADIAALGSNMIWVVPTSDSSGRPFTQEDVQIITEEIDGIIVAPLIISSQIVISGNVNQRTWIHGTTNEYLAAEKWKIATGLSFEPGESENSATVCILGKTVADKTFGLQDPLGNTLRVGRTFCEVVGLLEPKGSTRAQDLDDLIIMPLGTVQQRLTGNLDIDRLNISATVDGTTPRIKSEIETFFRARRAAQNPGTEDNFSVIDQTELTDTLDKVTGAFTTLLGSIAAVSLLVGGIGIMNIMFVSVTERTREIGIRIAIGAQVRDVLVQFLVESIALSTLGGIIGIAVGLGLSKLTVTKMGMTFVLSPQTVLLGFGFSVIIGIIFGFVPARKAANLNPIDALRHE